MPLLTELKTFLTGLKLSPAVPFTRNLLTLLKLTTLVGVATICVCAVYIMAHLAV